MVRVSSSSSISQVTGPVVPMALVLAILLVAGCSPKKVAESNPAAAKKVTARSSQVDNFNLPLPSPKGKSGREPDKFAVKQKSSSKQNKGQKFSAGSTTIGLKAADLAKKQLGKKYKWGASGPDSFDCSGLTLFVYDKIGVQLPRNSRSQAKVGKLVTQKELQPGDLLFFAMSGNTINHVGIYVGGNKFVHAPRKYNPVRTDSLNNSWWRQRLKVARRLG